MKNDKISAWQNIAYNLFFLKALGMLFWHKHNIERSLTDLANFTPFPGE